MLAVDVVFELINCVIIDYCREIKTLFYDRRREVEKMQKR